MTYYKALLVLMILSVLAMFGFTVWLAIAHPWILFLIGVAILFFALFTIK